MVRCGDEYSFAMWAEPLDSRPRYAYVTSGPNGGAVNLGVPAMMNRIAIARSNVDAGGPVTEPVEPTRTKIADRLWVNDAGESVAEEDATGFSYEFHGRTKDGITIPPDGKKFTRYIRDMSEKELHM